jgi:phospholipid/cholesterol/gamma-HCH transport system permease protein
MNVVNLKIKTQTGIISRLGAETRKRFRNILEFYLFSVSVLLKLVHFYRLKGICRTVLMRQVMFTGFDALALTGFISLSISALVVIEVHEIVGELGRGGLIYEILVVIVIRQLSSLFIALVIIARSATAISTELGNMVINREIDLLNAFGISPFAYLVVPRMLSVVISLLTLTLYFNFITALGGAVFYDFYYDVHIGEFISRLIRELTLRDFFIPVIKSLLFGTAIGLIACYHGLKVELAATEVPKRTMHTVVYSVVSVIVLNIIVTLLLYM